jgi:cytochrome c nitrite reductase small subunit
LFDLSETAMSIVGNNNSATQSNPRSASIWTSPWAIRLSIVLILLIGMLAGLGLFTFGYGKGASYLSNNPQGCVNCHIMQDHFDSWEKSTHHSVAVCNDCHLPHHPIGKWLVKGDNGFFHSLAFTLDNYHEPLRIKPRNKRVTQHTCIYCHSELVHDVLLSDEHGETTSCVHCHKDVGHALR